MGSTSDSADFLGRVVKVTRHGGLFQSNPRLWLEVLFWPFRLQQPRLSGTFAMFYCSKTSDGDEIALKNRNAVFDPFLLLEVF